MSDVIDMHCLTPRGVPLPGGGLRQLGGDPDGIGWPYSESRRQAAVQVAADRLDAAVGAPPAQISSTSPCSPMICSQPPWGNSLPGRQLLAGCQGRPVLLDRHAGISERGMPGQHTAHNLETFWGGPPGMPAGRRRGARTRYRAASFPGLPPAPL